MKMSNLLEKDFKLVEKKKIFFLVPVAIVLIAFIAGIIYGAVLGSPLNLGMDFTGGYTVNVKLSTKLNSDNYDDYVKQIEKIFENLSNEEGKKYGLKVAQTQLQGAKDTASIYVKYKAVKTEKGVDAQKYMEDEVNVKLEEKLSELFQIAPSGLSLADNIITVRYAEFISDPVFEDIKNAVIKYGGENNKIIAENSIALNETDKKTVTFQSSEITSENLEDLKEVMTIPDVYSGQAIKGDVVSATVSGELVVNTILAIVLAVTLMLIYIAFRFEVSSGFSAIVALMHDLLIMFAFVVIFHIEINATFIAALITILGYSINNTIVIFDRIREVKKSPLNAKLSPSQIANRSVKDTILRTINTTVTTLLTITMVAIIGVPSIRIFALPIIIGLIAGTYSSVFISPALWSTWKDFLLKRKNKELKQEKVTVETTN